MLWMLLWRPKLFTPSDVCKHHMYKSVLRVLKKQQFYHYFPLFLVLSSPGPETGIQPHSGCFPLWGENPQQQLYLHGVFRLWNVPHALCLSEPSIGRLQRLQRHCQKCSRRLLLLKLAPPRGLCPGHTPQTPVVGGALGRPAGTMLRELWLWSFGLYEKQRWASLGFCSGLEPTGRQQTVCLLHFMDGDEKEVGCDKKTRSVGVYVRGRSADCNSVSIIVVILCVGCCFFVFAFSPQNLKASLDGKTQSQSVFNGTLKQLCGKKGSENSELWVSSCWAAARCQQHHRPGRKPTIFYSTHVGLKKKKKIVVVACT